MWGNCSQTVELARERVIPEKPEEVKPELLDLVILWTGLRAAASGGARGHREAVTILEAANRLLGPSAALYRAEAEHYQLLGDEENERAARRHAEDKPPETAAEHMMFGRDLLREGDLDRAQKELQRAIDLQPQGLWPRFYAGQCAYRLGNLDESVLDFTFCDALASSPQQRAVFVYNRAKAEAAADRCAPAMRDYGQAVQLDDGLADAYLNRGVLYYQHFRRHREALDDLQRALDRGADAAVAHFDRAVVYHDQGKNDSAVLELRAALKANPQHKEAKALLQALGEGR